MAVALRDVLGAERDVQKCKAVCALCFRSREDQLRARGARVEYCMDRGDAHAHKQTSPSGEEFHVSSHQRMRMGFLLGASASRAAQDWTLAMRGSNVTMEGKEHSALASAYMPLPVQQPTLPYPVAAPRASSPNKMSIQFLINPSDTPIFASRSVSDTVGGAAVYPGAAARAQPELRAQNISTRHWHSAEFGHDASSRSLGSDGYASGSGALAPDRARFASDALLNTKQSKNFWTAKEDEILLETVEKCGPRNWQRMAELVLPARTGVQLRARWKYVLSRRDQRRDFSAEEDAHLLSAYEKHGSRWSHIARELGNGHTDQEVKQRYYKLVRIRPGSSLHGAMEPA
ncbi:Transcription factor MYB44 [Porphyridium purpureum]|uniref:Transcription factor MYB44 n=1 Tax=Porphyridium purpureum TaxID=35688 RepID=A0A5J4YPL1_PORPP|nr:Transcription factor MYB44 [Porphyridium purpureum]|eukprot:POR7020..scf296_7